MTIETVSDFNEVTTMMKAMLAMQNSLNIKFVGEDWREVASARDKVDYGCAILEEAQEFQACDPSWKWWKSNPAAPDTNNMKIELVDLLHFAMSEAMATHYVDEGLDAVPPVSDSDLDDLAYRMEEGYLTAYGTVSGASIGDLNLNSRTGGYDRLKTRRALHVLVASALEGINYISQGTSDFDEEISEEDFAAEGGNEFQSIANISWSAFWSVAYHSGMSLGDVYGTYMGKAVLNSFRIANGDKQGSYARLWKDGQEDNYYLMGYYSDYVRDNGVYPTVEQTMSYLSDTYAAFKATAA